MHAYRTHNCAELRAANVGETVRLSGWVHRKRDHGHLLFVDLRDHYGITQIVTDTDSPAFKTLDRLRVESVVTVNGEVVARSPETVNPNLADRRDRGPRRRRSTVQSAAAELPMPVARRAGLSRGNPPQVPLSRSSPRAGPRQHHAALGGDRLDPPPDDRPGLHRVPDADPDRELARGRARLSGAEPRPSGEVLRAPAGAADVQAADHGRRLRPLFPDRALLPRRGRPRRPHPGRILPARLRDELRHPGRRVQRDRAGAVGRVRGIRRRQDASRRRANFLAFPTRKRCSNTAATSPTFAIRC